MVQPYDRLPASNEDGRVRTWMRLKRTMLSELKIPGKKRICHVSPPSSVLEGAGLPVVIKEDEKTSGEDTNFRYLDR